MQFKPTHFILGACVVTALACGGGGSSSPDLSAKQRSYTPINLTYDNTTVDIKINGADIRNSANVAIGKNLVAWPDSSALVPSFRTTSPATPAGQVSYEIKKTGGSVLTLPTVNAIHTQADRQLFVITGTESAISGFYIPFLVPDDSNPIAVLSVTHLASPTFPGEAAVPASMDVHLVANPGDLISAATKIISGITYSTSQTAISPFGHKFLKAADAGERYVVLTAKDSLAPVTSVPISVTVTKNFNHFIVISRRNGIRNFYTYNYKYWNLP